MGRFLVSKIRSRRGLGVPNRLVDARLHFNCLFFDNFSVMKDTGSDQKLTQDECKNEQIEEVDFAHPSDAKSTLLDPGRGPDGIIAASKVHKRLLGFWIKQCNRIF